MDLYPPPPLLPTRVSNPNPIPVKVIKSDPAGGHFCTVHSIVKHTNSFTLFFIDVKTVFDQSCLSFIRHPFSIYVHPPRKSNFLGPLPPEKWVSVFGVWKQPGEQA